MIILSNDDSARLENLPGTFAGLMDLYECNYIGIRRLIPVMPRAGTCRVSHLSGGLDLHLRVTDRYRYTSELSLTYHFSRGAGMVAQPDLHIRIYHDAQQAEVMSAQLRSWPGFEVDSKKGQAKLLCRWHVNRFLYKWLNYCLHQGHRFPSEKLNRG